ncbi:MAG: ABC transporter permease subunit [Nitriliruptorales bacterium]|nr:ABC transporter permease subunit [Nitriliruptorales bacterium]
MASEVASPSAPSGPPDIESPVTPELERAAERRASRRGALLALPGVLYLVLFFAIPLGIVLVYSFATRSSTGRAVLGEWSLDSYARLADSLVLEIAWRSLWLALVTTAICLLVGYPFAYHIATRTAAVRNALLVLVMIPFWSNLLVRTYVWRVLLGSGGPVSQLTEALGLGETRLLFTPAAVLLGLVYGFLPFMILPLYAAIERVDFGLIEAARDLYASGWEAFRRVTLPLSRPGIVAGSILVFAPSLGAYVTPELLGGSKTTMLGSYVVRQFLSARDWPFGSSLSFVVMTVMLAAVIIYFRVGGRTL